MTTDFTKDELQVLADALDMMVRSEGNAMAQAGASGLRDDRVVMLTRRLKLGMGALQKVEEAHNEIVKAEQDAVNAAPTAAAQVDPPTPAAGG